MGRRLLSLLLLRDVITYIPTRFALYYISPPPSATKEETKKNPMSRRTFMSASRMLLVVINLRPFMYISLSFHSFTFIYVRL